MTTRPATSADWPAIAALLAHLDLPLEGAEDHLSDFVIAESDGVIEGVAGLEVYGADALLRSVAVNPGLQGAGVGRKLVEAVISDARARRLRSLTLLTTTAADYFPRFGFERIPREAAPEAVRQSIEFRSVCPASAAVMVLRLIP